MQYLVTIYNDDAAMKAIEGEDGDEFERAHQLVQEELRASGELVETHELSRLDARVVRTRDGRPVVADGPLSRTGDWAGGYYIVDCVDIDRAVEIAGRFVESRFAPVEVRRVILG